MRQGKDWARLRGMHAPVILAAIGARKAGEHWGCPRCGCLFEICDDAWAGVAIRCTRAGCILGAWQWPEHALAELTGSTIDAARKRLLEAPHALVRQRVPAAAAEPEWIAVFKASRARIGEKVASE